MLEQTLGGTVDVARGVKRDHGRRIEALRLAERQHVLDALCGQPCLHETRCAGRAEDLAVRGEMVEVRVRDERTRPRVVGVEPPADLGQPDT